MVDPGCIESSTYRCSTLDNVTVSDDPDGGMVEKLYDRLGNTRFIRDSNLRDDNSFVVKSYDEFSRLSKVFVIEDPPG
ncbi:MAG: hypothetical protein ACOCSE_00530 [Chitinivibrionales bacterium]